MRSLPLALLASLAACCSCTGGGNGSSSGNSGGNNGGGSTGGGSGGGPTFSIVSLDATPDAGTVLNDLALAVGPGDVVGVAYIQDADTQSDAGFELYDVKYVSWSNGQVSQPAEIDRVQNVYGVSVAFDSSGNPNVAYMGGQPYGGSGANASNSWAQSAAVMATGKGGSWTTQIVDDGTNNPNGPTFMGTAANCPVGTNCNLINGQCSCTSPYQDTLAAVVGLYSAIGFDSKGTLYDYFRNVGFGEFDTSPVGNASASRIDGRYGTAAPYTLEWAYLGDTWYYLNNSVKGLGGHLHLVMASDQPALVTDEFGASGGAQSGGQNADFIMRLGPNNWSTPIRILNLGDSQTGPSLAWNAAYGFAVVGYDESSTTNELWFTSSKDGVNWPLPEKADDVVTGASGWFPSVAIDPNRLEPTIADFSCSNQTVEPNLQACPASQRQVEVREHSGEGWGSAQTVDPAGGYLPKIAYLSTGKSVIAYFQLYGKGQVGPLVLAVEQ